MSLLLYEGLACQKDSSVGSLVRVCLGGNPSVQYGMLQALTLLRQLVFSDYAHSRGIFSSTCLESSSKSLPESSNSSLKRSRQLGDQSAPITYPSPIDSLLDRLQLPLTLVLNASISLHKPLTSLLWIHSVTFASVDAAPIHSWNTIVAYPSVVSCEDENNSESSSGSEELEDKRLRSHRSVVPRTSSKELDTKLLSDQIIRCYLESGNPYAALAVTQSGQMGQQILIQCQTQRVGFTANFQK